MGIIVSNLTNSLLIICHPTEKLSWVDLKQILNVTKRLNVDKNNLGWEEDFESQIKVLMEEKDFKGNGILYPIVHKLNLISIPYLALLITFLRV